MSARICAGSEFSEKAGLSDPGLPDELQRCRPAPVELGEKVVERAEFVGPADKVLGKLGHLQVLLRPPYPRGRGSRNDASRPRGRVTRLVTTQGHGRQIRVRDQGGRLMSAWRPGGRLVT